MKYLLFMLSFYTRIPVKYNYEFDKEDIKKSVILFPFVGLIIGFILYLTMFLERFLDREVVVLLLWIIYIWITGGLHIDGLTDTFDGIFSNRDKNRILEILKDSRIGTFGVLGLLVVYASNYILSIHIDNYFIFMIMPFVGRSSGIISASVSKYARKEGMGGAFIEGSTKKTAVAVYIFTFMISIWPAKSIFIFISVLVTFLYVYYITSYVKKKIDGITGDIIGFVIETSQTLFLAAVYVFQQII